ncbi:MAG: P-II family nitrogen regulator [Bacillota bacterium]|jgi:nitrogen regulatory protein PII 1
MLMIRAIIRPAKVNEVLDALSAAGFPAVTKIDVFGRGKQKGLKVGDIHYDELPKEMLLMVVDDAAKEEIVNIIMRTAKTGDQGAFGDGKIFVSPVEKAYTISSTSEGL